ncbi:MAG: hypothetical protein CMF50_04015 [Legionellales bacterium]|nr:hypothetical protein [Legionellales bacterium]|tara:strand:+ start:10250 stop:11278 length:1029 start_codon:yes stop_codon:yes gene_type:complete
MGFDNSLFTLDDVVDVEFTQEELALVPDFAELNDTTLINVVIANLDEYFGHQRATTHPIIAAEAKIYSSLRRNLEAMRNAQKETLECDFTSQELQQRQLSISSSSDEGIMIDTVEPVFTRLIKILRENIDVLNKLEDKKFNERPSPYRERSCPSFQWGIHRYKPLIKVLRETIAEFAAYKVLKNNQATTDKLKHGLFPAKKVVVKNTKQLLLDLLADRISCLEKRENSPSGYFYFTSTHKISALSALKGEVEQADGNADFETIVSGWLDGNHSSINTEGVTNRSVINSNLFFFSTNLFSSKTETFIAEMNKILHDQTVSGNLPSSDINATPKQAKYSFKYSR